MLDAFRNPYPTRGQRGRQGSTAGSGVATGSVAGVALSPAGFLAAAFVVVALSEAGFALADFDAVVLFAPSRRTRCWRLSSWTWSS